MEKLLQKYQSLEMNELHRAVQGNHLEAVKCLMKNGADVTNTIANGQTPLHLAVSLNYHPITQELFENKSREMMRNLINRQTLDTGTAALHLAVRNNSLETTRYLLARGANFEIQDNENRQPKHQTTDKRILQLIDRIEIVFESSVTSNSKILIEKLNFCSADNLEAVMYARNRQDFSALQFAMEKNQLDNVATIISFRIDNLKQDDWMPNGDFDKLMRYSKATRRHLSNLDVLCRENDSLVVDLLVKKDIVDVLRNAHEFLSAYKEKGDIQLHDQPLLMIVEETLQFFGSWKKSQFTENKKVDLLLRKGPAFATKMLQLCIDAPMQFFMKLVYTPELIKAAKTNDVKLVEKCLHGHPDMNKRDEKNDWSALHYALNNENVSMIKLLLDFGADPTAVSEKSNESLLHFLVRHPVLSNLIDRSCGTFQLLSDRINADNSVNSIDAQSKDGGATALRLAAERDNFQYVEFFLSKGATYCAKDSSDKLPQDYCRNGFATLRLLQMIDELFTLARDAKFEDVARKMKESYPAYTSRLLAVGGARNNEGQTLIEIAELRGCVVEADEIRKLLVDAVSASDHNKSTSYGGYWHQGSLTVIRF